MRIILAATVLAVLFPAIPAHAQQCPEPTYGDFERLQVAEVKPGQARVAFTKPDCSSAKAGACLSKAYVIPGDLVLIARVFDTSACAVFVNAKGRATVGLLPINRLRAPTPHFRKGPAVLIGQWTRTEADIAIKQKGGDGTLSFLGTATWGGFDKRRIAIGAVYMGYFQFSLKPDSNTVNVSLKHELNGDMSVVRDEVDPDDCAVSMIGLGPYLVVEDNRNCGGMNVSFTGVYRRSGE